jgi:hypothetical protein
VCNGGEDHPAVSGGPGELLQLRKMEGKLLHLVKREGKIMQLVKREGKLRHQSI